MRLSERTRFPHPVLAADTGDYLQGDFAVSLKPLFAADGSLTLGYEVDLKQPDLQSLLNAGTAAYQLLVVSNRTYYVGMHLLDSDGGTLKFDPGQLFGRVTVRPLICSIQPVSDFTAGSLHPEFGSQPWSFAPSQVLAYGEEMAVTVGQEYLAAIGAIFTLVKEADVLPGKVRIDPEGEQVRQPFECC